MINLRKQLHNLESIYNQIQMAETNAKVSITK